MDLKYQGETVADGTWEADLTSRSAIKGSYVTEEKLEGPKRTTYMSKDDLLRDMEREQHNKRKHGMKNNFWQ